MFGSWFDHVKSWLNAEDKERMMYISYEEMKMVRFHTNPQNDLLKTFSQKPNNKQIIIFPNMRYCVFLCGAGPEGLCGQNLSVLGEISGRWGDREDRRPMFVQEHEEEQDVKLLSGS